MQKIKVIWHKHSHPHPHMVEKSEHAKILMMYRWMCHQHHHKAMREKIRSPKATTESSDHINARKYANNNNSKHNTIVAPYLKIFPSYLDEKKILCVQSIKKLIRNELEN